MKEFALIKKYFLPLTDSHEFARNLSDDTAKITLAEDEELVISKDLFVQDCHFLLSDGGFLIAKKFLLVNLSDIAASGSQPAFYMLGFSKNKKFDSKFYREFALGLREVQDEFGISLIGGDTVESPMAFFSITIFGIAKKNQILRRNCGEEGDEIFVSGSVGDAGLGLKISQKPGQNLCLQQAPSSELRPRAPAK
jgi:thiamine-monophosphate kinase